MLAVASSVVNFDTNSAADLTDARTDDEPLDKQAVRYQQWQTALSARKIGLVDIDT